MFRPMRRFKQELSQEECADILGRNITGVLAVCGDEGYPYTVPMNYDYRNGKVYFHCARAGHKLDAIQANDKVSFCVIDKDTVVPEEYTTYYRSVVVFGRARVIEDDGARRTALENLAAKYCPEQVEGRQDEVDRFLKNVCMIELTVEHMSGKAAKELVLRK